MRSVALPSTEVLMGGVKHRDLLMLAAGSLLCIGLVMVASASMGISEKPFSYLVKHLISIIIGFVGMGIAFAIPTSFFQQQSKWLLLLGVLLAAIVLVAGRRVNGSIRWIDLGPITIQASEVTKFAVIAYLSSYLIRFQADVRVSWMAFLKPMGVVAIAVALFMLEPDFGASIVLVAAVMGMLFLAGAPFKIFASATALLGVMGAAAIFFEEYRLRRFLNFTDPWADQFNSGYQLAQSLIAFGRGEWFGVGLGNSVQKLFYLPEAHTDFVLAVFAEEFGLVGMVVLISLFWVLTNAILKIGYKAEKLGRYYQAYLSYGIAILIGVQALVNIGVNMGLLPTKGLTLPLVSYGGSSLIVVMGMLAIVLRIDRENTADAVASEKRGRK
jgi:cell division protein FtsW